ncbi:hypothetical protein N0V88_005193 [Collariella sp. IMI 366227]|nr:hypothetical protein N0V88_005193 [Collariella sp. IMI 366227]
MAEPPQLFVFGDQAVPYAAELRRFIAKRADYTLTILDLVDLGPEMVLLAFRLGLAVQKKTVSVMSGLDSVTSVSFVVAGIDRDTASSLINDFCRTRSLSPAACVYISAIGNSNVTVSGPPVWLDDFFSQNPRLKSAKIAMSGLFHSDILYDPSTVVALVKTVGAKLRHRAGRLNIVSNSEGDPTILPGPAEQALHTILSEILLRQMRWDLVAQRAAELSRRSDPSVAAIFPFAAGSVQGIASAIRESRGGDSATIIDTARQSRSVNAGSRSGADADAPGGRRDRSKIAIIGYSGRFPEAENNEEFWDLFLAGLDVVKNIPKDRFDPSLYCDPTGKKKNTSGVMKGCFVKNPDLFDSRFFGMSPREAEQADPAQRLALMTAYEAMEMAGFVPDSTPSTQRNRVGVFYGTASDDYREVNSGQNIDTYFVPGGSRAFLPARINYHFRFSGPSFDVDTACSSGLAAVHIACNSLWTGDCDVAITGGTNILTNPDNWAGLDRAHFLSRTGNCKTFDDGADGYCRAESVATVLLKRLDDALLDGDPIHGVILGALTNHSAEAVSITRPHSGAQRAIFSRILNSADVDSADVSYVEMHGTGTQHGDACEMDSVLSVFAPEGSRREQSLHLGSAKANIGHAESASGITSLIKVLLMMEKSQIPRHVGIKTKINTNFPTDLDQRNVHIAMQTTPWPRTKSSPSGKRRAFVNNFGAAGGNSSVLLEDAPPQLNLGADPRPLHIVAVSAKSQAALKRNICALVDYLKANPGTSIGSLSYTTTARRVHHNFRVAVTGKTIHDINKGFELAETREQYSVQNGVPIGLCFTGQGAQYLGMGRRLLEIPRFRCFVVELDELVRLQHFDPILHIIEGSCTTPLEQLPSAMVQLATTCLQMALGKFWRSLGITPQLVVGHSLGDYAAMNIAGALSDADTIYLVGTRARLLEKHCRVGTHAMLAVKASVSSMTSLITSHGDLEICCANGPEETVIGGPNDKIEVFAASLARLPLPLKATQLKVQFAFHSAQVEPMLDAFRESCGSITFKNPSIPFLSPLLGKVVTAASDLGTPSAYLSRHCRETVNFYSSLQSAKSAGAISDKMVWVEIGSHPTCSNSLKATLGSSFTRTFPTLRRGEDDWAVLVPTLTSLYESGLAVNWDDYHGGFKENLSVLRLPAYRWDLKSHWIPYVHDWCLTKGNPPIRCNHDLSTLSASDNRQSPVKKEPLTTSVQDLVEESYAGDESWIVARSDVQHPYFQAVLRGHRVNGQPVCSSAVYADMALTLFSRLLEKSPVAFDKSGLGVEVSDLVADKSLILNNEPAQLVEMKAHVHWSTKHATFSLSSIDLKTGKSTDKHAKCNGTFSQINRWKTEWSRREYLIKARVAHLRQSVDDEDSGVSQIKTGIFYKLFSSLVDYEPSFRGCRELIMRSADFESTAKVKFNTPPDTADRWAWPPYWLDSLGQITGFTMNANDTLDSKAQVFINHGWENMRISEPLSQNHTYQTYVKMQDKGDRSYIGDVYIFSPVSHSIIAVYEGVTFSAVPRKILDKVLPHPGARLSKPATTTTSTAFQPTSPVATKTPAVKQRLGTSHVPVQQSPSTNSSAIPNSLIANKVRTIIAEEVGAPIAEVVNSVELADLGVDSLLSLTMADRILEELGVKVDSSLFITGLKVQDLVKLVGGDKVSESSSSLSAEPAPTTQLPPAVPVGNESHSATADKLRAIVADEVGAPISEVVDDIALADLGVDSLLSLTIADRLLEELGVKVDSTLFMTGIKVNDLIQIVAGGDSAASESSSASSTAAMSSPRGEAVHDEAVIRNTGGTDTPLSSLSLPSIHSPDSDGNFARSADINTFKPTKTLWLFPDGSGLAISYLSLPDLGTHVAVYGLNSPFVKNTTGMDRCGLEDLITAYMAEVRRRQPRGPYLVGGWSAGGLCAYRAAQRLVDEAGATVEGLVLIDSPEPMGRKKLPARLYDEFNSRDIFGTAPGRKPPAWLLSHFMGFSGMLDGVKLRPWRGASLPTWIVWAADGVDEEETIEIRPEDPWNMTWLLRKRRGEDLGANGWDFLVGKDRVEVEVVQGANHFSLMQMPGVGRMGAFLKRVASSW